MFCEERLVDKTVNPLRKLKSEHRAQKVNNTIHLTLYHSARTSGRDKWNATFLGEVASFTRRG